MVRTLKIAQEANQEFAAVTYDLAIAQKAYAIQALEAPRFKNLILLGNFHLELAFFRAVGTFLKGSGIETVLAEGSLVGFIKGKFYNRCQRIHELTAIVLERSLFQQFTDDLSVEEKNVMNEAALNSPSFKSANSNEFHSYLEENHELVDFCDRFNGFFANALNGLLGKSAQYWTIYIFLINRVYRNLQRCVRTNDLCGYKDILPTVLDVFFFIKLSELCSLRHSVFASTAKCLPRVNKVFLKMELFQSEEL